ncbi:aldo/keto reductase [Streptomyces sp. SAS_260]|uniref:aldo/keto reductase n=1 Tax=Streptomyces sp. SAS_260 TaxID=3412751 RepID=UPI00403D4A71
MRYSKLGTTGLEVSAIALGCMSFGEPDRGGEPWSLGADASRDIIRQALESGVNFLDTANGYSAGSSEEIVGQAVKDFTRREEVVLSTKVWMRMRPGPNGAGLSRKAIFAGLDASLRRLGTDYIDLYQIHRWDYDTPIEETLEALHDAVRSGKVRYIGASSMYAWQFAKALFLADLNGWTRFVSMQDHYNLIHREAEREMLTLCADQGIGVIPWSPLARGRLTRVRDATTARAETDEGGRILYRDEDQAVAERVHELAGKRGLSPAQVALAWVMRNPAVTSPVVGVTKPAQLADAVAAMDVELDDDEAAYLEEPYQPHQAAYLEESFYKSRGEISRVGTSG